MRTWTVRYLPLLVGLATVLLLAAVLVWLSYGPEPQRNDAGFATEDNRSDTEFNADSTSVAIESVPLLTAGTTVRTHLGVDPGDRVLYRIQVPKDAVMVELEITESPINVDLFVSHRSSFQAGEPPQFVAQTDAFRERLRLTPWDELPLEPGEYVVEVRAAGGETPRIEQRPVRGQVSLALSFRLLRAEPVAALPWEKTETVELSQESGFAALRKIVVPAEAETVRIDLFGTQTSLDMYLGREGPIVHGDNALLVHDGWESRKWWRLTRDGVPPLQPDTYYLAIVDPAQSAMPIKANLRISTSPEPPDELLRIPSWSSDVTGWQLAALATVEVLVEGAHGSGSGVIVTPTGLVLTNYHVVLTDTEQLAPANGVLVAMTLDMRDPPQDLFRGTVILHDAQRDLALVQITEGFYHQPLDLGLRFPWLPLGDPDTLVPGDPLTVLGYPGIGGSSTRVSVTLTRGVLSGFERRGEEIVWKTDADFHPGSSGGPVLDTAWRVVGLASETAEELTSSGKIGWIRPLSNLPAAWRPLITQCQW